MMEDTTTFVVPKLNLNSLIPAFELTSVKGEKIHLWDYKLKKNLLLVFMHDLQCHDCFNYANLLAQRYQDFKNQETEVLVILQDQPSGELLEQARQFPFPILIDENGHVGNQFLEHGSDDRLLPGVFVIDRYNALFAGYETSKESELPNLDEVLASLSLLEIQCPECGI